MTPSRFASSALLISTLTIVVSPALAQDAAKASDDERALPVVPADSPAGRFGLKSQIAVSSDAGLSLSNTSIDDVDGSTTSLVLRPAVDWFFAEDISFGGFVGVEYTSAPGGDTTIISLGPRVGYNVPLSERVSLWPKAGFAFASTSASEDGVDDEEANTSVQLNLFVPFMFHPVQHFFLGLGPALDQDLSGDSKATTIAVRLALGGWI